MISSVAEAGRLTSETDPDRRPRSLPRFCTHALVFSNLKTWLRGIHHGVSPQHLQAYRNEFTFRFNRRFSVQCLPIPARHRRRRHRTHLCAALRREIADHYI